MQTIKEYIPVTKAKSKLLDLVRNIKDSDDTIAITKNGVPEVVLISMNKFLGLLETMEILSDEKAMMSIRKSIREADKGMWVDLDEVIAEHTGAVEKITSGETKPVDFLIGQVMKKTKGKADPKKVRELIQKSLKI